LKPSRFSVDLIARYDHPVLPDSNDSDDKQRPFVVALVIGRSAIVAAIVSAAAWLLTTALLD